jgi:S1-C subfamily serine protease
MKKIYKAVVLIAVLFLTGAASAKAERAVQTPERGSRAEAGNGGFLGAFLSEVDEERAMELKLSDARGAAVSQVVRESPAERAGLKENDVILSYNEQPVRNPQEVHRLLMTTPPGSTITLGVSRAGKMMTLQVTVGERQTGLWSNIARAGKDVSELYLEQAEKLDREAEELRRQSESSGDRRLLEKAEDSARQAEDFRKLASEHQQQKESRPGGPLSRSVVSGLRQPYRPGLKAIQLSEQLGRYFNTPDGAGLLVTEVEEGSVAARAGLKAGDCIIEVGSQKAQTLAEVTRLLSEAGERSDAVTLRIIRDRKEQTLRIEAGRR